MQPTGYLLKLSEFKLKYHLWVIYIYLYEVRVMQYNNEKSYLKELNFLILAETN